MPNHVQAPKEYIHLYPEFIDLLEGDHLAALMLSRIYYWCALTDKKGKTKLRVSKNGRDWLVKSNSHWAEELRLSRSQTNRCLTKLRDLGLIKTELHKFQGAPTLHILYTGQLHTNVQSDCTPTCNGLPANVQTIAHQSAILYTVNTDSEYISDYTQHADAVAGIQAVPENQIQQEQDMNANDILGALKTKQDIQTGSGINAASLLWKKRTALEGQWSKDLTGKERGQLKHAMTALGDPALKVLDSALQEWQEFANRVAVAKGCTPAMKPDCGFFCKYSDVAFAFWQSRTVVKPKQVVQSIAVPAVQVAQKVDNPPDVYKPSLEELQATLAKMGGSKGGI